MKRRISRPGELIKEISSKIIELLGEQVVSIVFFGSLARRVASKSKTHGMNPDLDFLIILKEFKPEYSEKLSELRLEYLLRGIKIDTVVLSVEDSLINFSNPSPLFASLVLGNQILYDTGFFAENFRKMIEYVRKSSIKFVEGGKIWDLAKIASGSMH